MKFLIDVDGVVADLTTPLLDKVNKEFGKNYVNDDIEKFYFMSHDTGIMTREECDFAKKELASDEFASSLPLVENARESIYKILGAGHEILWVTTLYKPSKTWTYDRNNWLDHHFYGHGSNLVAYIDNKENIPGDVLIDDKTENILSWSYKNPKGKPLLYTRPWNLDYKASERVRRFTWDNLDSFLANK